MIPQDAVKFLDKTVRVNNPKFQGLATFTAYIFRIKDNRKIYQAEIQRMEPPHEIYIVSMDDISEP